MIVQLKLTNNAMTTAASLINYWFPQVKWEPVTAELLNLAIAPILIIGQALPELPEEKPAKTNAVPFIELVKVNDHFGYNRLADGSVGSTKRPSLCYIAFASQAMAKTWQEYIMESAPDAKVESRKPKHFKGATVELKVKGLPVPVLLKFKDTDFTRTPTGYTEDEMLASFDIGSW